MMWRLNFKKLKMLNKGWTSVGNFAIIFNHSRKNQDKLAEDFWRQYQHIYRGEKI